MKHKKIKFSSVEKLLPLLQQLQQTYAKRCHSFWIHTRRGGKSFWINISINLHEDYFVDFDFYSFQDASTLEYNYKRLCDYLNKV